VRLLIQIPCFNEENTLLQVLESIPKKFTGISSVDIQLIDDGSTDQSIATAEKFGVKYILQTEGIKRRNLGTVFQLGQKNAVENDYDILVNLDGDNQYPSSYIKELIKPIINSEADLVIGNRKPHQIKYFSKLKRFIQKLSNQLISFVCQKETPDAVSGFRAFSKKALNTLVLKEKYTYTIESLMQSYAKGLKVSWVDIEVNAPTRDSHLIPHISIKLLRSGFAVLKFFFAYFIFRKF
jgi:glycosyltransferase involved in cell wall biosynthesis